VLVTGGSQGIGLAIAQGCADAGDDVTVLSRRPPAGSPRLPHLACDLRDPRQVAHALSSWVGSVAAPVDAVIHCAVDYGSSGRHPFAENTVEEWEAAMQVNARGLMLVLQQVLPQMTRRGRGLVIGLSSEVAERPGPERIPYAASKAAAHAVLTGLAAELAHSGVTVVNWPRPCRSTRRGSVAAGRATSSRSAMRMPDASAHRYCGCSTARPGATTDRACGWIRMACCWTPVER
jgi:uncharacterized oxidoreductase